MAKAKFILIIVFLFTQIVLSQNKPFYTSYSWEESPTFNVSKESIDPIIAIKDKTLTEFYFQDNGLVEYFLEHKVLWLNSDDKIEKYNKIYLPYSTNSELKVNKARVINKKGQIIELDESKILTAQDEETGKHYKFFAFEGVEKGSFVEYFYVVKRYPRYKGNRITFQADYLKRSVEFDLYAPKNLIFKFKTYNNTPNIEKDTLSKDKLHWHLKLNNLQGLVNEEVSAYNAFKNSVIYKLDQNTADKSKDISSYSKVAQNIYSFYYPELSSKIKSKISEFIKEATNNKKLDEESLIRKLEFFIKSNVFISEDGSDSFKDLNEILTKKVANETGIMKLYAAILKTLNIKHEIVLTTNRQQLKFDKSFEANNFLTDFLIYFNKSKTYLSPTDSESRYGFPPAYLTDNYGLFIKEIKIGEFVSGLGKVKYINPITADKTIDKMVINVVFDKEDITNCKVKLNKSMSGYYAMYFQPYIHLFKQENKDELIESFAKSINKDVNITKKEIVNDDPELFGVKPIKMIVDFESDAFIEKAGNKYLFKVGDLIGKQMEMYQEKKRVMPVENEFTRSYYRTININIPDGYKIANLDDINIDNSFTKDDKELLVFKSYYDLKEKVLTITADEHYRKNIIGKSNYEEYRKVINSAADFNKVVLVFEPI